ncbi:helix-turn-helix domain-containing protein [Psychrobacillus glaciei]|uniref:Helix-turn-helix domain-containing protein n=1 Tax=Psychrobacillus glaciei TaxID=2283160 RepID=A0A5J6SKS6_9BACI|nr:RodZ family helix-turn-helix domain-containing protein [Psychrobacillus glaciei]QFF98596.1 helix-turn-helix domain-containing protein [Psychrobacillus glaciei]
MTELGSRLKEARKAKGFSIDDLQEITKIQKRYLTGIEEGNYETMPGSFYVRAFIKQYAEAVGLNGDELLEMYKTEIPTTSNEDVSKSIPQTPTRRSIGGRSSNKFMEVFPMIVVALFVIAIIVILWTLFQKSPKNEIDKTEVDTSLTLEKKPPTEENSSVKPVEEETPKEDNPSEEVVDTTEETKPEQQVTFVETQGPTSTYDLTGADKYDLKVVVANNTWLNIRDQDNKILVDKAVNAGETFEFDASALSRIRVRVGHTPGNMVYINEQLIEFPTTKTTQNLVIQFNK